MKKKYLTLAALLTLITTGSVFAYETQWSDKKAGDDESMFKVDGTLTVSLQTTNHDAVGNLNVVEQNGRNETVGGNSNVGGFNIDRAYVNISGSSKKAGVGYRITTDAQSADDKNKVFLKFAWIDKTLYDGGVIRVGMQGVPTSMAQTYALSGNIQGRDRLYYNAGIARLHQQTTGTVGLWGIPGVDMGLTFNHKGSMWGLSVGLFNGEGYKMSNAERLVTNSELAVHHLARYAAPVLVAVDGLGKLDPADPNILEKQGKIKSTMGNGTAAVKARAQYQLATGGPAPMGLTGSDGAGVDINSILYFTPVKSDNMSFTVAVPFIVKNVLFTEEAEYHAVAPLDLRGLGFTEREFVYVSGEKVAKKDYAYALDLNYKMKTDAFKLSVGGGPYFFVDKRGSATFVESWKARGLENALANANDAELYNTMNDIGYKQKDMTAKGQLLYATVDVGPVGFYVSEMRGQGANGRLAAGNSDSVTEQLLKLEARNNNKFGDLRLDQVNAAKRAGMFDEGKAHFVKQTFAVTYNATERLAFDVGYSVAKQYDSSGKLDRVNKFQSLTYVGVRHDLNTQKYIERQMNTHLVNTEYKDAVPVDLNDYVGQKNIVKDLYIVATYNY